MFLHHRRVNYVAIFAGSFALAAWLTMGFMNARMEGDPLQNQNSIWSRLLLGRSPSPNTTHDAMQQSTITTKTSPQEKAPVLVLGMPRSGSLSIHKFFTCNQIQSSHYCCDKTPPTSNSSSSLEERTEFPCRSDQITCGRCVLKNMKEEKAPFHECGNYSIWAQFDVETSEPYAWFLPQHHTLPLLHEAYPHAAIILNYRGDPELWADSVLHWHSVTSRIFNSFDLPMSDVDDKSSTPQEVTYEELVEDMQTNLNRLMDEGEHQRKRELLKEVFVKHLDKVRQWARDYDHPLLEVNVDDPNAGKDLAQAFQMSPDCWNFDADKLDNDWKNFTFPF